MPIVAHERCAWAQSEPAMQAYHDAEWGVPQCDPRMLWEMLILAGFQAGLVWIIILRKNVPQTPPDTRHWLPVASA